MRKFIIAAALASLLSPASAADLAWKKNPDFFPNVLQAYNGSHPFETRSGAALARVCPNGPDQKVEKYRRCGDATVKILQCGGSGVRFKIHKGKLYAAKCGTLTEAAGY